MVTVRLMVEDYLEDCALFVAGVPTTNPLEGLNMVLNGASSLSLLDMKKTAGQACEIACTACKPLMGSHGYGASRAEAERAAAMVRALSTIAEPGL